jgi:hypothetical protein
MVVSKEMERISKEMLVTFLKALPGHLPRKKEGNHKRTARIVGDKVEIKLERYRSSQLD